MERIKEVKINGREADMWRGQDAEGRKMYAVKLRRAGVSVEPSTCTTYTQKAAIQQAKANA